MLDNHVHTSFSMDCKEHMEDVIQRAIKIGVNIFIIYWYACIMDKINNNI